MTMNKKKALFTSLAALALATTQSQTFAEEVNATVSEPVAATEATPAEPVVEETPVAVSAGEVVAAENSSAINVDALLAGDFSTVAGEWQLEGLSGTVLIDENGYLGGLQDDSQKLTSPVLASEISPGFDNSVLAFRGGKDVNTANIDDYFFFYPAGMPLDRGITSDETRDRLVIGHKESSYLYPYYLVTTSVTDNVSSVEQTPSQSTEPVAEEVVSEPAVEETPVATNTGEEATTPAVSDTTSTVETTPAESVTEEVATQPVAEVAPTPVSTGLVGTWLGDPTLEMHGIQLDRIVIAEDGSYTIYQTNTYTGATEEKTGQITSMEQIGENRYLITENGGLSGIYSPGFATVNKVESGLEIFADKFGVFYRITDSQTGEVRETDPIGYVTRLVSAVVEETTKPAESVTEEVATQPVVKEPVSVETSKTEPAVEDASVAQTPSIPTTEQPTSETVKESVLDKADSAPTSAVVEPQPTTKVVASKTPTPTAKKDGPAVTPAPSSQAFAGQQAETVASKPTYSRVEAAKQAEATQTGLPNTGDVTSLLGVIGASLSALGLTGLRRRNK